MRGIFIQQSDIQELTTEFRKILQEELAKLNLPSSKSIGEESTKLLSKKEAAAYLTISLPTLTKLIKSGNVKALKIGKSRYRFRKSDLQNSLNKTKF